MISNKKMLVNFNIFCNLQIITVIKKIPVDKIGNYFNMGK